MISELKELTSWLEKQKCKLFCGPLISRKYHGVRRDDLSLGRLERAREKRICRQPGWRGAGFSQSRGEEGRGCEAGRPSMSRSSKLHSSLELRFSPFKDYAIGFETNPEIFGGARASLEWKPWEYFWQERHVRPRCLSPVCFKATPLKCAFSVAPNPAR